MLAKIMKLSLSLDVRCESRRNDQPDRQDRDRTFDCAEVHCWKAATPYRPLPHRPWR
jgi:hypothetical protein